MVNPFEERVKQKYSQQPQPSGKSPYSNPFEERARSPQYQEKHGEGWGKSTARLAAQPGLGYLNTTVPGIAANLFELAALGESELGIEEWHKLRELAEQEGKTFDEEAYEQARHEMLGMIPTVSNITRKVEEETGLPLEPKTRVQKGLRFATEAGRLAPSGSTLRPLDVALPKPVLGAGLEAGKELLQETGVPESLSELASFLLLKQPSKGAPSLEIGAKTKPSGLPERRFEKVTEPREVSQGKLNKINEKVESDFRAISDRIIKESPIGETFENLKNDPTFKQESRELLDQAQQIADATPGTLTSKSVKKEMADISSKKVKGFALSEYDKSYMKYMKEALEDIIPDNVSHGELVEQYRKNNRALGEYFEPGASKALNRAKRDALLDQNRAIAQVLEKSNPELSSVFKEGNQRWTKIMDAEAVDEFVNEMFEGKLNYKKMNDFFDKSGYEFKFKRALGEEGYKAFEGLMKDMLTSETAYKMLKVAKDRGFEDLFKTGIGYIIHPKLGVAKAGYDAMKYSYRALMNAMLDNPQLAIRFKKGVKDLKKADFKAAEKEFAAIEAEVIAERKAQSQRPKTERAETVEVKGEKIAPEKTPEAEKKEISHLEKQDKIQKKPIYEMSLEEVENELKNLSEFDRKIIEPKVGKEVYEGQYANRGFEGKAKFWEKYADLFNENEINLIENVPYTEEELRARQDQFRDIRTSYNSRETPKESINALISELRSAFINPKDPINNTFIQDGINYLLNKGHTKTEIAEEIFKVMKRDLSDSDAKYVLDEIFREKQTSGKRKSETTVLSEKKQLEHNAR